MENNKLIAEFLEWQIDNESGNYMTPICFIVNGDYKEWADTKHVDDVGYYLLSEKIMEFHRDWNWLMPVVEKIERDSFDLFGEYEDIIINGCGCFIHTAKKDGISKTETTKIQAVYNAVVDYIKWNNIHNH